MVVTILRRCGIALLMAAAGRPAERPDVPVVLITIDTLRADRLGCYGYRQAETPNLDRLARDSVLFRRAFTPAPLTLPAHASLFTGVYPALHGVRDNEGTLDARQETLALVLRRSRYSTGAFVGSLLLDRRCGLAAGFDYYGDTFVRPAGRSSGDLLERPADAVVDEALGWISRQTGTRWFAWLHVFDPHDPYAPPAPFRQRHAGRPYDGEIAYADSALGRLFERLRMLELYDRALIVVTADHGEGLGEHGEPNHGLFLYDTTLRVPLLVKLPNSDRKGEVVDRPVSLVDVQPTVLALLSVSRPVSTQGSALFGRDQAERTGVAAEVYSESLYLRLHFGWSEQRGLRTIRYKYIESTRPELYDVERDGAEAHNLAGEQSALAESLRARLRAARGYDFGSKPAPGSAPDRERLERLAALGYLNASRPMAPSAGAPPDPKDRRETLQRVLDGMTFYKQARYAEAAQKFSGVLAADGGLPLAYGFLGSSLFQLGRYEEAIRAFRGELRLDAGSPTARYNLARCLLQTGQPEEAGELLRRLVDSNPGDEAGWRLLGKAYLSMGKNDQALACLERARSLDPRNGETYYLLGRSAQFVGRAAQAEASYRKALELDPRLADALVGLGGLALGDGKAEEALEYYGRALALQPDSVVARYQRGVALLELGRAVPALEAFHAVLRIDPKSADARNAIGLVLERQEKHAAAAPWFREAVRLQPTSAVFQGNLGVALMESGKLAESIAIFRSLVEKQPGNAEARGRLAEAEARVRKGAGKP